MAQTTQKAASSDITVSLRDHGRILEIGWPGARSKFHSIWLRDNGRDSRTRDPSNGQKLITIQDIPAQTALRSAEINRRNQLELLFDPDGWETFIDMDWLRQHRYDRRGSMTKSLLPINMTGWDASLQNDLPVTTYTRAKSSPEVLLQWLMCVDRYGFAILDDIPGKNAAVLDVIDLFGYPRETNYGEYFEIRSEIKPINLANTRRSLQSHTDNPYRNPTPGLQLFGCLENSTDGGESIVVDGFKIAQRLHQENPDWFELLSKYDARFEFNGADDVHLVADRPVIRLNPSGQVVEIHFNNRSCGALTEIPFDEMEEYYRAYRRFSELVNSPDLEVRFKLRPRQLYITDNTRVLHGRTGFFGAGNRWMQGAYADKDSLQSKIRVLQKQLSEHPV